jgi:hypothetical protein
LHRIGTNTISNLLPRLQLPCLKQSYAALGLAHRLDGTDSGGRDHTFAGLSSNAGHQTTASSSDLAANVQESERSGEQGDAEGPSHDNEREKFSKRTLPQGYGRIVRDETGAVVDVILAEDTQQQEGGGEGAGSVDMDEGGDGDRDDDEIVNALRKGHGPEAAWLLGTIGEGLEGGEDDGKAGSVVRGACFTFFL